MNERVLMMLTIADDFYLPISPRKFLLIHAVGTLADTERGYDKASRTCESGYRSEEAVSIADSNIAGMGQRRMSFVV